MCKCIKQKPCRVEGNEIYILLLVKLLPQLGAVHHLLPFKLKRKD